MLAVHDILQSVISQALDNACDSLRAELHKVSTNIVVTHEGGGFINVFADAAYEAYVPKRYCGWNVLFTNYNSCTLDFTLNP